MLKMPIFGPFWPRKFTLMDEIEISFCQKPSLIGNNAGAKIQVISISGR